MMSITAPLQRMRVWAEDTCCYLKNQPTDFRIDAPYFSQFMSADLVEDFITGKKELVTDPRWQQSGADSPEEYARWTWCDCGITCFKMVLTSIDDTNSSLPLVTMAKDAATHGAFKVSENEISPLHYAEFCLFAKNKYGLKARTIPALSLCKIKECIANKDFVIASVHPNIRHPSSQAPKRGGHLVLVVGYDKSGLYIHNPSGYQSNSSQDRAFVAYKDFKRFFAYRGIVINNE